MARAGKKKLDDALFELARTNRTSHREILNVSMARIINNLCGGAVIAPWDVWRLSDAELDMFRALANDLPELQSAERAKEKVFEDVRAAHPNYRKY